MKIIALLTITLFPNFLLAQKKYAPLHAEWKYEGHSIDCFGFHQKFTVEKEILIQKKDCSVIFSYLWNNEIADWIPTGDSLIVWEDEKKVYFLSDTSFYLLYDFAPALNDTIYYFDPINKGLFSSTETENSQATPNQIACRITSIEEIEIESGQILKRFQTENLLATPNCTELGYVLENVGSLSQGITGDHCYYVATGCFGELVCYRNDEIAVNSDFYHCELFTDVEEAVLEDQIKVFPNPTKSDIFIEIPDRLRPTEIEIVNLQNQLLVKREFTDRISLENFGKGVYLVSVLQKGKRIFSKKVIRN